MSVPTVEGPERKRRGFLLAGASSVLLLLAQPPFQSILLPWVALVPLTVALARAKGPRAAAWQGVVFGLVYWGALLLWVPLAVAPRFSWAYPGYLAQVGLLSGLMALMAWGVYTLREGGGVSLALALPLAWVGMEWLKAHFPMGLSFPWLGLGMTLSAWPELLGMAEWTGEAGVAFWLALVNAILASAVLAVGRTGPRGSRGALRLVSLAALVAVAPALLGIFRSRTLSMEPGPRVAVVGTGVPARLRLQPEEGSRRALEEVEALLAGVTPGWAGLVVLPEAVVGVPLDGPSGEPYRRRLGRLARHLQVPVLVGGLGKGGVGEGGLPANSAFLVEPGGDLASRYDKSRLVPGMEWGGYEAGPPGSPIRWGEMALGPLICYESLFGALTRRYASAGATLLVNLTSDVWFGTLGRWPGGGSWPSIRPIWSCGRWRPAWGLPGQQTVASPSFWILWVAP